MKQGMPEYEGHTPYEFLPQEDNPINLDAICREVVEDAIRDKQVGGSHYTDMRVQPWDVARQQTPGEVCGYHCITAIGYLMRHKSKGGLQDIKKAHHHLSELIRYFEEEDEYPW